MPAIGRPRAARASGVVSDDRVAQHAQALDVDLDDVAGLEQPWRGAGVPDARRRAGRQQVAGLQGEGARDVRQGVADRVDHLLRGAVLHRLAVDPGLHPQPVPQVADLGRRDQRAQRPRVVPVLAENPLAGELLRAACRQVVEGRVAHDGGQRLLRGRVHERRAHPCDDLALPVQPVLVRRDRNLRPADGEGARPPGEQRRVLRQFLVPVAALGDVLEVVEPDADDARVGRNRRDEHRRRTPAGSRPRGAAPGGRRDRPRIRSGTRER